MGARCLAVLCLCSCLPLPAQDAVITCKEVRMTEAAVLDPFYGILVHDNVTLVTVFSNGHYIDSFELDNQTYQLFKDESPFPAGSSPYGSIFPTPQDFVNAMCPGGIQSAVKSPASQRSSAGTWVGGQAAGPIAFGDFNGDGVLDRATLASGGVAVALLQSGDRVTVHVLDWQGLEFGATSAAERISTQSSSCRLTSSARTFEKQSARDPQYVNEMQRARVPT